jgi:hypothetical protein
MYKFHPGFAKTKKGQYKNDLALVFAVTPFDLRASNKVKTIALPPPFYLPGESLRPKCQSISFYLSGLTDEGSQCNSKQIIQLFLNHICLLQFVKRSKLLDFLRKPKP